MENRFGFKDAVIIILLVVCVTLIALSMLQFDRQWDDVQSIQAKIREQDQSQARIEGQLKDLDGMVKDIRERGVTLSDGGFKPKVQGEGLDFFRRVKIAQELEGYQIGGTYYRSFASSVGVLTPLISQDVYASIIQGDILESLAYRDDETLEWLPRLAQSWMISEDGMVITFKMKKDINFSDGVQVTADDVVFTFNFIMNPDIDSPRQKSYFNKIEKVEKIDEETVQFTFREPYFESFELAATMSIFPKHFYSKFTPEEFNKSVGLLMGSGPYRLETPDGWEPSDSVVMYRNDRYWGEPAPFDRVVFKIINQDAGRLVAFRNGEIDSFGAQPKQYIKIKDDSQIQEISNRFEYLSGTAGYRYIGWNQKYKNGQPSPFADKRVRQAMTYLTPRQMIVDKVQLGFAQVTNGPFHPNSKQRSPNVETRKRSLAKANQLLTAAGFRYNPRTEKLTDPRGRPFTFKMMYPSGSEVYEEMMSMLENAYAQAGIIMVKDPIEWSVFLKKLKARDFQAMCLGWSGGPETDIYQMFHSDQIKDKGDNVIHYSNPELDEIIIQARKEVDEKKRMPLWQRAHEILFEDQPYTFLVVSDSLIFMNKRLKNIQKLKMGLSPDTEWFISNQAQMQP